MSRASKVKVNKQGLMAKKMRRVKKLWSWRENYSNVMSMASSGKY